MLKADNPRIRQTLARLSTDTTFMEWLGEQKVVVALSMATARGEDLAWRQGAVQVLAELEKEIIGSRKKIQEKG